MMNQDIPILCLIKGYSKNVFVSFLLRKQQVVQHGHNLEGAAGHMLRVSRQQIAHGDMPGSEEPSQDRNSFLLGLGFRAFESTRVYFHSFLFIAKQIRLFYFSCSSPFWPQLEKPSQAD